MKTMKTTMLDEEYTTIDKIEDDDRLAVMKEAILSLRPVERKIFLTYTHLGTYTETASYFNVSVPTIRGYIQKIRTKIFDYYAHNNTDAATSDDSCPGI